MKTILIKLDTGTLAFSRPAYGQRRIETVVPVQMGTDPLDTRQQVVVRPLEQVFVERFGRTGASYVDMVAALDPIWAETEEEFAQRIGAELLQKLAQDGHEGFAGAQVVAIVDEGTIPSDQVSWKYRDAWDWTTEDPSVDMDLPKARAIRLAALRTERNAELETLDVEAVRTLEQDNRSEINRISTRKQVLRDAPATLTPSLDAAQSLTELEAIALP